MKKIRKGDEVIICCGKDKGKRGTVLRYEGNDYVVVQGLNKLKKHIKPNPTKGIMGSIAEIEQAIHVSNIAIYNPQTKKADKIGFSLKDDKLKTRVFKSTGEQVGS